VKGRRNFVLLDVEDRLSRLVGVLVAVDRVRRFRGRYHRRRRSTTVDLAKVATFQVLFHGEAVRGAADDVRRSLREPRVDRYLRDVVVSVRVGLVVVGHGVPRLVVLRRLHLSLGDDRTVRGLEVGVGELVVSGRLHQVQSCYGRQATKNIFTIFQKENFRKIFAKFKIFKNLLQRHDQYSKIFEKYFQQSKF
jgi:hypothetical protein